MSDNDQKKIVEELQGIRLMLGFILLALGVAVGFLFTIATHV